MSGSFPNSTIVKGGSRSVAPASGEAPPPDPVGPSLDFSQASNSMYRGVV